MNAMHVPARPMLELIVVTERHKRAYHEGHAQLSALLGHVLPSGWPQFPQAFAPSNDVIDPQHRWPGYFFVDEQSACIVGNGGYHGPPNSEGEVEIGYEIAPAFRNRGYATMAAHALIAHAFGDPSVRAVVAQTLPGNAASAATLRKAGMRHVESLYDARFGTLWRWRIERATWR